MSRKEYIHYFDYLRIIAAFGVIYMHVAADSLRAGITTDWHGMNIVTSLAFTAVPLFFMMSGYLLLTDEKTADVSVLLKKRLPRLVIPLLVWTVVAIVWKMILWNSFSFGYFVEALISALGSPAWVHLWYLYMLIALYILSPFISAALNSLDKKGHMLVLCVIVLVNLRTIFRVLLPSEVDKFVNFDILNKLCFFDGYLFEFILGYYLGKTKKHFPNAVLLASGALVWITIVLGTYYLTSVYGYGNITPSFQNQATGFEVLLACIVFIFFKQNFNRPAKRIGISSVTPLLLGIYLMHNFVLSMLVNILRIRINTFIETVVYTAIIFAVCLLTMKITASLKPLCFATTGISYDSACSSCNFIYTFKKTKNRKHHETI